MNIKKILLVFLVSCVSYGVVASPNLPASLDKIAFGSCAKEYKAQPIWDKIAARNPDLFLFIGDNQYADTQWIKGRWVSQPVMSKTRLEEAYSTLANIPQFNAFRQSVPLLGMWDDHDYGLNDGGTEYHFKQQSQQVFLDFFGFAKDAPIREQEGVYQSYTIGEQGQRVQIILLDTRYHRDPLDKKPASQTWGRYHPTKDTSRSMLGEQQWKWFEQQLLKPADVRLVISSIQIVAYQHGWESWGLMPHERQRLYDLIGSTKANGVIFLSGDRHLMEISKDTGQRGSKVPYPMWDFTSSGMTDDVAVVDEANDFRIGPVYRGTNFGEIQIKWGKSPQLKLTAFDQKGAALMEQFVSLNTLRTSSQVP